METTARPYVCRHFAGGLEMKCNLGVPIRQMVIDRNGDMTGISFMTPCRPTEKKILDCRHYSPKTDDELKADRLALSAKMDAFVVALPKINLIKHQMVKQNKNRGSFDCPYCGEKGSFVASCNITGNRHLHGSCSICLQGFIE